MSYWLCGINHKDPSGHQKTELKYIQENLIEKQKLDKYNSNRYFDIPLSNLTDQMHKN